MKKVYIETNGCAVLRHETYKIAKYVELNEFVEVSSPEFADYIIITGCAVIDENEDFAMESIERLYNANKDHATIIVSGCIPSIAAERITKLSSDIIQIPNNKMNLFDNFFYKKIAINDVTYNINPKRHHSFGDPLITIKEDELKDCEFVKKIDDISNQKKALNQFNYSTRGKHLWREADLFEIRVSYGCSSNCSYCATKLAIGNFRSVDELRILDQAREAKLKGFKRIMLMGDEVGAWQNKEKNIVNLIDEILKIDPEFNIGIRYIHPDIIVKNYERLCPFFEKGSIFYFCSAFQSGSARILRLMNRNPNLEPFIKCMEDMVEKNYPVLRHTQIIIGFPTETDSDVLDTLSALQRSSFDHVTITQYSPRKGTMAYNYENVAKVDVERREKILNDWLELNRNSKIYKIVRNQLLNYYEN